jgi:CBS domain containing-hemolysin-like protein
MFTRKNKITDHNSTEYNIMNFNDALVSDKMISVKKIEILVLDGTKDEIIKKIILTRHLTLPVLDKNKKILGCIRTDEFLKKYLTDKTVSPNDFIKKLTLISKDAHMSDVFAFANGQRPILGVIDLQRPSELIGVVSINHIMRLLSADVFVEE